MPSKSSTPKFTFIDLFSGIGGFHYAMKRLGGQCVFASEIDPFAINTYKKNHHMDSNHDITKVDAKDIPDHDVLCGGFPCQAFSKAGPQLGFEDTTKGTLFFHIVRILRTKQPPYLILENVRNLLSHDQGNTWRIIQEQLIAVGYNIKAVVMSPHQLNIPQLRERVYILGIRRDLYDGELEFNIPEEADEPHFEQLLATFFDTDVDERYNISEHEERLLNCWDDFRQVIPQQTIGFPLWYDEFRGEYPLDNLPVWKADFIRKNRAFYQRYQTEIDEWRDRWNDLQEFTPTERKFEWQAGEQAHSVWECYIQLRPSGVRVKAPTSFPALVALVQIPIIGPNRRRLTPREAARLQSFPRDFRPDENDHQAYKQLGNAVNVNCVEFLARQLFSSYGNNNWGINTQNSMSSQLDCSSFRLIKGYDSSLKAETILNRLSNYLEQGRFLPDPNNKASGVYTNPNSGKKLYVMVANLTFMGGKLGQHPVYKKRIQYDFRWRDYYIQNIKNGPVIWLGLYSFNDIDAWVIFEPKTYLEKQKGKGNFTSRSCHADIRDIQKACKQNKWIESTDQKGNKSTAIPKTCLSDYFSLLTTE